MSLINILSQQLYLEIYYIDKVIASLKVHSTFFQYCLKYHYFYLVLELLGSSRRLNLDYQDSDG